MREPTETDKEARRLAVTWAMGWDSGGDRQMNAMTVCRQVLEHPESALMAARLSQEIQLREGTESSDFFIHCLGVRHRSNVTLKTLDTDTGYTDTESRTVV